MGIHWVHAGRLKTASSKIVYTGWLHFALKNTHVCTYCGTEKAQIHMQGSSGKCNGKVHTRLVIFQRCGIMANFYVFFCCHFFILKNKLFVALAAVAQWVGHQPAYQRVASSIPSQGTCLGCRPGQVLSGGGGTWEATTHCCFSPSLPPSLPLCLK